MENGSIYEYLGGLQKVVPGASMSVDEAVASARTYDADKAICVLQGWCWIDLEVPDSVLRELLRQGLHPVMLVAQSVLFESLTGRPSEGWIRSAPMVRFIDGYIFETTRCLYVLDGQGRQVSESLSNVIRRFRISYA